MVLKRNFQPHWGPCGSFLECACQLPLLAVSPCGEIQRWFPIKHLCFKPLPCFAYLLLSWVCRSLCLKILCSPQLIWGVMLEPAGLFSWLSRLFPCFCYLSGQLSLSFSGLLLKEQISKCSKNPLLGWIVPLADYYVQHSCDHWSFLCYHWSSDIKMGALLQSLRRGNQDMGSPGLPRMLNGRYS